MNQFNVVDWLAFKSLNYLKNKLTIASNFNMDYVPDYKKAFAPGETIRVPLPKRWVVTDGLEYQPQNIQSEETDVSITEIKGIHFEWNTFEEALRLERPDEQLRKNYSEAPMNQLAQTIDLMAAQFAMAHCNNFVGNLNANPNSMTTYNEASALLFNHACPQDQSMLRMALTPGQHVSIASSLSTVFNPQKIVSDVFKRGVLGEGAGFDEWVRSVSLPRILVGNWQGAVTVSGAGQEGFSLLVNCTSGDTFLAGNNFTIEDVHDVNPTVRQSLGTLQGFVITENVTATGSTATIPIYPKIVGPGATPVQGQYQTVDALPANGADLTLFDGTSSPNGLTGTAGLAWHRDAFLMAGVPLENPPTGGGAYSRQVRDPDTGITLSFVRFWDQKFRKWTNRWDCAFGFGVGQANACAVKVLGNR